MPSVDIAKPLLQFRTQRPREDGCGGVALQMLTGRTEGDVAELIGWGKDSVRHSNWADLTRVLAQLGWRIGEPIACSDWSEVRGIAIVHVHDDHFMLYDADSGLFYDPWEWEGPSATSERVPMSYLTVEAA